MSKLGYLTHRTDSNPGSHGDSRDDQRSRPENTGWVSWVRFLLSNLIIPQTRSDTRWTSEVTSDGGNRSHMSRHFNIIDRAPLEQCTVTVKSVTTSHTYSH